MKRLTATLYLVLASSLSGGVQAVEHPVQSATVPFDLLKTKHIVVSIKLNGHGPYRVIFDTGAPVNILNNKTARDSGILAKDSQPSFFSLFGSMGPNKIKSLEVGGVKIANTSAVVMDHPTVELISKAFGPIEGIVGYPFFARYKMTLDYQTKEMTLRPNGLDPPDAMESMMTNLMSLADDDRPPKILAPAAQWGMVLSKDRDDKEPGVSIREVLADSAVSLAGLKTNDRLMTIDGRWTDSIEDTYLAAGFVKPGSIARVVVQRDGKEMVLEIKPRPGL